jgi:hypothetical protein
VISLNDQNIFFALKENASIVALSLRIPVRSLALIGLDFPLTTLIGIAKKRKQLLTYRQEKSQELLERRCSARHIQYDQKITTRHEKVLIKTNNLYAY